MGNGQQNEPNWAVEIEGLKKDVKWLQDELLKIEARNEKIFDARKRHVDRRFEEFKTWIKEEYVPLNSFRPLTKWLTIIGVGVISMVGTIIAAVVTFILSYFTRGNGQ